MLNNIRFLKTGPGIVAVLLFVLAGLVWVFMHKANQLQKPEKNWSEADFKTIVSRGNESQLFGERKALLIFLDSESQILVNGQPCRESELAPIINRFKNTALASSGNDLENLTISGAPDKAANSLIFIKRDSLSSSGKYQTILNIAGNCIMGSKEEFAVKICKKSYCDLNTVQRNEIDQLVPVDIFMVKPQILKSPLTRLIIEVRKDGNYMNNKSCSLTELEEIIESRSKTNREEIAYLKVETDVPMVWGTEVKELLLKAKIRTINLSLAQSSDQVYLDAAIMPRFPGGEEVMNEWISQNMNYPEEAKSKGIEGEVLVNFVVGAEGKVRDVKTGIGIYPALDAEAERVVALMPNWEPGKEKGIPVNILCTIPIVFRLN